MDVLFQFINQVKEINREGGMVDIKEFGTFLPSPLKDGTFKTIFVPCRKIMKELCPQGGGTGETTPGNMVECWIKAHPENPA